ncbi:MAG: response regulator transcription factor, partial [Limisphaerales bacterium]
GIAAMKAGAVDYLVEPVDATVIADAIETALAKQLKNSEVIKRSVKYRRGWQTLTDRERQVLSFITNGYLNKQIAAKLGIAEKTVKVHRSRVMKKMQVASFAELVRLAERASIAENLSYERSSNNASRNLERNGSHAELAPTCLL